MPALLTTISRPPKASVAARTMASTSAFFETSQETATTLLPSAAASCRAPSPLMSAAMTRAPSSANSSAIPRPKPDAAPVTIATLSCSFPVIPMPSSAAAPHRDLPSRRKPRRLGAIGARRIGAEHLLLAGEERKLLQRELHRPVGRMAFDVGVEHGRVEGTLELIALELRHVDAVGRETAQRLVEGGRNVEHAEDEGRDDGAISGFGVLGLGREHDEARRVVHLVLDVTRKDLEAVDLRRERRC